MDTTKKVYIVTKQAIEPQRLGDIECVYVKSPVEIVKNNLESIELVHYDSTRGALWIAVIRDEKSTK